MIKACGIIAAVVIAIMSVFIEHVPFITIDFTASVFFAAFLMICVDALDHLKAIRAEKEIESKYRYSMSVEFRSNLETINTTLYNGLFEIKEEIKKARRNGSTS